MLDRTNIIDSTAVSRPRYVPIVPRANLLHGPRLGAIGVAVELMAENAQHGAPWVSFGDVHVDDGGNARTIDRSTTCYVTSSADPLPWLLVSSAMREAGRSALMNGPTGPVHEVTLPAFNVWWLCRQAGLHASDYGRTWFIYESRAEYLEGLD